MAARSRPAGPHKRRPLCAATKFIISLPPISGARGWQPRPAQSGGGGGGQLAAAGATGASSSCFANRAIPLCARRANTKANNNNNNNRCNLQPTDVWATRPDAPAAPAAAAANDRGPSAALRRPTRICAESVSVGFEQTRPQFVCSRLDDLPALGAPIKRLAQSRRTQQNQLTDQATPAGSKSETTTTTRRENWARAPTRQATPLQLKLLFFLVFVFSGGAP